MNGGGGMVLSVHMSPYGSQGMYFIRTVKIWIMKYICKESRLHCQLLIIGVAPHCIIITRLPYFHAKYLATHSEQMCFIFLVILTELGQCKTKANTILLRYFQPLLNIDLLSCFFHRSYLCGYSSFCNLEV